MSGVAIARYLLANDASLTAQVPAARIMAGILPLNITPPAISVTEDSAEEHNNVAMDFDTTLRKSRVSVRVLAATYPSQKTILELARLALPNTNGTVNGITVDSIVPDASGPDEFDPDLAIYSQDKIFVVNFRV